MEIYIADIETSPFLPDAESDYSLTPLFMCIQDFNTEQFLPVITDFDVEIRQFFKNLANVKKPVTIYFHNLDFDSKFFFDKLPLDEYEFSIIPVGGKLAEIRLYKTYKTMKGDKETTYTKTALRIRDSLVILLSSLETIGNFMGFPKGKINYGLEITEEYIEYCRQDCRIVTKALKMLLEFVENQFGLELAIERLPLTLPAIAKKVWGQLIQKEYPEIPFKYYFAKDYINEKYRPFYFGGRVEVFNFNVCKNGYYNDFNSFYGSIMYNYLFPLPPYKEYKCSKGEQCWKDWNADETFFGAICEVIEDLDIPLVPIRLDNFKIVYPVGRKLCFLFREQIEYLLSLKQKVKLLLLLKCAQMLPIFKTFVEKTYFARQKLIEQGLRDSFFAYLLKIFLNALYGKFAERKEKEKITLMLPDQIDLEMGDVKGEFVNYGDLILIKVVTPQVMPILTNVFFSMRITALTGMNLHKRLDKDSFYCDTDSIVSQDMIEDSAELGHLKPEFRFDKFQAFGPKEYATESKGKKTIAKMKGFGREQYNSIKDFAAKYLKPHKQMRVSKIKEIMNRHLDPASVLIVEKVKRTMYDKRWIKENLQTRPLTVEECRDLERIVIHNSKMIERIVKRCSNVN